MKKGFLVAALAYVLLASGACAPKSYPRTITAKDRYLTNTARFVDIVAAKWEPRSNIGRRYDLERQTPKIEYSFYIDSRFKDRPDLFYLEPEGAPSVEVVSTIKDHKKYRVDLIRWRSQYKPQNPDFALRYENYIETQTAWAIHVWSKEPNRGAIVMSQEWTERKITRTWKDHDMVDYLEQGYDSVLIQQPYHGLRALYGSVFSGEYFLSGDVARINEAMCQSVTDARSMVKWMRKNHEVVGVKGRTLGATTSLMTAVLDPELDFVIAWNPLTSFAEITEDMPIAPFAVEAMKASNLEEEVVKKALYLASPARFDPAIEVVEPKTDLPRVIVFAGMGDTFVTQEQPLLLWQRWNEPPIVWYSGGYKWNPQKKMCSREEADFLKLQLGYKVEKKEKWHKRLLDKFKRKKRDKDRQKDKGKKEKKGRLEKLKFWKRDKKDDGPRAALDEPATPERGDAPTLEDMPRDEPPEPVDIDKWTWEGPAPQ